MGAPVSYAAVVTKVSKCVPSGMAVKTSQRMRASGSNGTPKPTSFPFVSPFLFNDYTDDIGALPAFLGNFFPKPSSMSFAL